MEMDPFFAMEQKAPPSIPKSASTVSSDTNTSFNIMKTIASTSSINTSATAPASNAGNTNTSNNDSNDPGDKINQANQEISNLLSQKKITQADVKSLQAVLHENVQLNQKTQKLKQLLARSAKAQSDFKAENQSTKHKLEQANKAIERLNHKIEQLANRPTHMDMLADFEANFDRALLSMGTGGGHDHENLGEEHHHSGVDEYGYGHDDPYYGYGDVGQTGGEDPAPHMYDDYNSESQVDNTSLKQQTNQDNEALLTELTSTQNRVEHLESLNSVLKNRAEKLEQQNEGQSVQILSLQSKNDNLQLELRMAKTEAQRAQTKVKEKTIALREMQIEIDLVTKASVKANARASESMEVVRHIKTDKQHVDELEAKVEALQEWALASAEAKRLTVERTKELEDKLKVFHDLLEMDPESNQVKGGASTQSGGANAKGDEVVSMEGRKLWMRSSSKVVGAGMVATYVVPLGDCKLNKDEIVVLKWKFDIIPGDLDIDFSILKGKFEETKKRDGADNLIKERIVVGGAGGEVSGAFAVQSACTLVWSNKRSWIRPRAIKFSVEAFAINM